MKRKEFLKTLDSLSNLEYLILVSWLRYRVFRYRVALLRPAQILPFIVVAQMLLLVHFTNTFDFIFYLAGNVAVVCVALIPITIESPKPAVHWVR